jgi:hypothetical protein
MKKLLTLICFALVFNLSQSFSQAWLSMDNGLGASTEEVKAVAVDPSGNIYVGGTFTGAISYVAKWNGTTWTAVGTGVNGPVYSIAIKSASDIYFGGSFSTAGGNAALNVARWDGGQWLALGSGFNGIVRSLFVSYAGTIYAGGEFSASGSVNCAHIAKLNSNAWEALGTGIPSNVNAIAEYPSSVSGFIYAGTDYTGGAEPVMKYNGSSSWSAVTGITGGRALALATFANYLYAGGDFSTPIRAAAKYNGTDWSTIVTSFYNWHTVNVLYSRTDALYIGGNFTTVGLNNPSYIARITAPQNPIMNFTVNSALANGEVKAIGKSAGYVVAGGMFSTPTTPVTYNVAITNSTIDVNELSEMVVNKNFYPNPAHNRSTLTLNTTGSLKDPVLKVYDVQSKLVKTSATYTSRNNELTVEVDLSEVPVGNYYYVVSSEEKFVASDIFIVE